MAKKFVRPRVAFVLNQKLQVHLDRRTKRGRDRSSNKRQAIERSANDE